MSSSSPKCTITVLKRTLNQDLIEAYLQNPSEHPGMCEAFQEGQVFNVDQIWQAPEGFCSWAWADIRQYVYVACLGGEFPGANPSDTFVTCCTDSRYDCNWPGCFNHIDHRSLDIRQWA